MSVSRNTLAALIVWSLWTRPVDAAETNAPAPAADAGKGASNPAEAAFDKGLAAADAGDWKLALESFLESQKYEAAPGTTLNIARCRESLGQNAAALVGFKSLVAELPEDDERAGYARTRVSALEPQVSYVTLSLPAEVHDVRVFFDGVELAPEVLAASFPVDPGEHEVVATAAGREKETVRLTLLAGQPQELLLEGGTPPPPPVQKQKVAASAPVPTEPERGMSTQRLIGFGGIGLGAVSIVVSGITGALAIDRKNTMEENCHGNTCTRDGLEADDAGDRFATVSTATFGAGLVLLGAGAALIYFDGGGPRLEARAHGDGAQLLLGGSL